MTRPLTRRILTRAAGLTIAATVGLSAPAALAQQAAAAEDASTTVLPGNYTRQVTASFDDATFAVEQAITNSGLVIDSTHQVGEMLARTKQDVGGAKDLYAGAEVYSFCSAVESRKAMEADINNIQFCPYNVFVFAPEDTPDQVTIGHRIYPGDSMAGVNKMLDAIVDAAAQ